MALKLIILALQGLTYFSTFCMKIKSTWMQISMSKCRKKIKLWMKNATNFLYWRKNMKKVFCSIVVPLFKPRYKSFFSVKNVCTHKIYITSIQNILHKTFKKCNDCWIKQYSTSRQRNSHFFVKRTNFCMHLMKKVNSFWCQGKNSP